MVLDKTKTIKQRRVEIYLPTLETKEAWTAAAQERGASLSEFIFHIVHSTLSGDGVGDGGREGPLRKEIDALTDQVVEQQKRIEALERINERNETSLEKFRAQAFLASTRETKFDARLVRIFSEAKDRDGAYRTVTESELLKILRFAHNDEEQNKAFTEKLSMLETHGVIVKKGRGWAWNG